MALIKLSYPFPWSTISEDCNVLWHYNMRKCAIYSTIKLNKFYFIIQR